MSVKCRQGRWSKTTYKKQLILTPRKGEKFYNRYICATHSQHKIIITNIITDSTPEDLLDKHSSRVFTPPQSTQDPIKYKYP